VDGDGGGLRANQDGVGDGAVVAPAERRLTPTIRNGSIESVRCDSNKFEAGKISIARQAIATLNSAMVNFKGCMPK
jgi:hypothetical protein